MKFLVYSKGADGVGMAIRLKEEGNQVWVYIKDPDSRACGQGLVDHVESPAVGLSKHPDCVVFDMTGMGDEADRIRKMGFNVIGASSLHDRFEHDRAFAMDLCKRLGINMPDFFEFKRSQISRAMDFIAKTKKRYVLKPDNNSGGTALTYVSKSPDDMIQFLEWADKRHALKVDFILQEFVPGVELSTEVWFARGTPVNPPNSTMELKKLMPGDVGPNTGCMASVVWPYAKREPRIVQQTLKKLYPALQAARYTGPIDINAIIAEEDGKAYFLEFTPRFGYSAIYALAEILEDDLGKVLHGVAIGQMTEMKLRREFGMAVRLAIPPYPLEATAEHHKVFMETAGRRVRKLPDKHSWLLDCRLDEGELVTAGSDGVVCEIGYSGKSLQATADKIYEMIKHVELPDMIYRVDGVDRVLEGIPQLHAMGYEVPDLGGTSERPKAARQAEAPDTGKGPIGGPIPVRSQTGRPEPEPAKI